MHKYICTLFLKGKMCPLSESCQISFAKCVVGVAANQILPMTSLWWLFYVVVVFHGIMFPFQAKKVQSKGKYILFILTIIGMFKILSIPKLMCFKANIFLTTVLSILPLFNSIHCLIDLILLYVYIFSFSPFTVQIRYCLSHPNDSCNFSD